MLNAPLNPRAVPGSNEAPDYAQQVTDRIAEEYREVTKTLDNLLEEARGLPKVVENDEQALLIGALIKRMRDVDGRIENIRTVEGEPYLRGKNAVDSFFFALRDKIGRRNKNDRKAAAGATDVLQARINEYQEQKIAEERARREAEALAARRAAEAAEAKAREEARLAEEARKAAERARLPETTVAKTAVADQREQQASIAQSEAATALQLAEDARLATLAKPADLSRIRGNAEAGGGVTLTTAREPYAMLVDRSLVDMNMLRPYFTEAEIEKAVRGWAKATGHIVKMPGTEIGFRNRGVTR